MAISHVGHITRLILNVNKAKENMGFMYVEGNY